MIRASSKIKLSTKKDDTHTHTEEEKEREGAENDGMGMRTTTSAIDEIELAQLKVKSFSHITQWHNHLTWDWHFLKNIISFGWICWFYQRDASQTTHIEKESKRNPLLRWVKCFVHLRFFLRLPLSIWLLVVLSSCSVHYWIVDAYEISIIQLYWQIDTSHCWMSVNMRWKNGERMEWVIVNVKKA